MRLIAFFNEVTQTVKTLNHIGVDSGPLRTVPARWPLQWDDCGDAQNDHEAQIEPD